MSEWSPEIVRIQAVTAHPNADNIELINVLNGYRVCAKKGDFQVGDLAAYVPPDSITPDDERFEFLIPPKQEQYYDEDGKQKTRILGKKFAVGSVPEAFRIVKAKKLRGIFSTGFLIKGIKAPKFRDNLDGVCFKIHNLDNAMQGFIEGDSIVDFFNLKKWEEPEDDESYSTGGINEKGVYKLPYYDLNPLQRYFDLLVEGDEIVLEEKLHGANISVCHVNDRLWVKTRKHYRIDDGKNVHWQGAKNMNLVEILKSAPSHLAFFGEVYGQVGKYPYGTGKEKPLIRFFDVYDTHSDQYLDWYSRNEILNQLNLPAVPLLDKRIWKKEDYEEIKKFAEGQSTLDNSHIREGFVLRTTRSGERTIFKCVGEAYKLKK